MIKRSALAMFSSCGGLLLKRMAVILFVFFIAGCSAPEEQIHHALEETIAKEKEFEKLQKPLAELERKDTELFNEIMTLGMKEFQKITELADEAVANLDKREELLEKEKAVIEASQKEFNKINPASIDKLKEESAQKKAAELKKLMDERYASHAKLVNAYEKVIKENRKMYEMIKQEDLELEELEVQIEKVNEAQEEVIKKNEQFNEKTESFNEKKTNFYTEAGIEIKRK